MLFLLLKSQPSYQAWVAPTDGKSKCKYELAVPFRMRFDITFRLESIVAPLLRTLSGRSIDDFRQHIHQASCNTHVQNVLIMVHYNDWRARIYDVFKCCSCCVIFVHLMQSPFFVVPRRLSSLTRLISYVRLISSAHLLKCNAFILLKYLLANR